MLTLPGDIPLVTAAEIERLLAAHRPAPSFTIAPSHDEQGSNAIIMSPPDAVTLRFGDDSFFPHLAAAEARGIAPDGLAPARDRAWISTIRPISRIFHNSDRARERACGSRETLPRSTRVPGAKNTTSGVT